MASLLGIITILVAAWLLSTDRKNIPLEQSLWLSYYKSHSRYWFYMYQWGKEALNAATGAVSSSLINYGQEGINFLFGGLTNNGFVFAINVLGIIIFFSLRLYLGLYHRFYAKSDQPYRWRAAEVLGHRPCRIPVCDTANISLAWLKQSLVVKPYLKHMTDSQLFAVMVCGLASVAGGTLVGYASLGVDLNYLIAAAFMSAPAGLLMAKILVPGSADDVQENIESDVEIPRATKRSWGNGRWGYVWTSYCRCGGCDTSCLYQCDCNAEWLARYCWGLVWRKPKLRAYPRLCVRTRCMADRCAVVWGYRCRLTDR